ncbi:hypothetical protein HC749_14250 [Arthrobacter sp. S13_S34]|nr:hypothetical protein [Arthrobacter sp. S13_S34]
MIFTAIQPVGGIHLGNYLAVLRPWASESRGQPSVFLMGDNHGVAFAPSAEGLRNATASALKVILAFRRLEGLDDAWIIRASRIPEFAEFSWLIDVLTSSHQPFRQLVQGKPFPYRQAAEILLMGSNVAVVGPDHVRLIEVTAAFASLFNETYGRVFDIPVPLSHLKEVIPDTVSGGKMHKPGSTPGTLLVTDDRDVIRSVLDEMAQEDAPRVPYLRQVLESAYPDKPYSATVLLDEIDNLRRAATSISEDELESELSRDELKARQRAEPSIRSVRYALGLS